MIDKISDLNIKDYLLRLINENTLLIHNKAMNVKVSNLLKIGGSVNSVYSFCIIYKYNNKEVKLNLILKLFDKSDFHMKVCQREYKIIVELKRANFSVPTAYLIQTNENPLGGPFIVMEKIEGMKMEDHLKGLDKKEFHNSIKCFAETLVLLHELKLEKIWSDFLSIPTDEYDYARKSALVKEELDFANKWDYDWVTTWLKVNAEKCPCSNYSLLHVDMNLKNFIINNQGKIFFSDWEWGEVGDALRDVSCAYHEIRHLFGDKAALFFLKNYKKSSKRKIEPYNLRFYLVSSGLKLALYFRFLSTKTLSRKYLIQLFGKKAFFLSPVIRWHFSRRRKYLENYIRKKISGVSDYEKGMFGTPGGEILSSMEKEDILKLLNSNSSDLILDVGTATGRVAREIVSKTGARVIGIDVGRKSLLYAKKRKGNLSNFELVVAHGQHLPFRNLSFDSILCIRALKYFPNYVLGISEMDRVLKLSGHLIIDISSVLGYELILRNITRSVHARGHHVFNIYKIKNLLERQKLFPEKSLPLQKIPHKIWNLSSNSTILQILVVLEQTLKKITPQIFSRSILLKCKKVSYSELTKR